jgi:predicted ATPase/class 3 adenylate cyclase
VDPKSAVTTFLFTDIEGSTSLWEREPDKMRAALARHDQIVREAVEDHHGVLVKSTGDGIHAAFSDPADGVAAAVALQRALADPAHTAGVRLSVRCGLHAGVDERRDGDYFGVNVNRAARIMSAAHGGQVLVSQTVTDLMGSRLAGDVALRELGAVRLRDLAGPERLWQVVVEGLRHEFPALRSLEATPNNLPQQLTTFVGREREMLEIQELLGSGRLLTLCGMGGLGKTRLALQTAADVVEAYPDGVWFVELAAVDDARLVPQVVASVLGVKDVGGKSVTEALLGFAKDRTLLLLLDNCEHLGAACAELAVQLLQSAPGLRILATSRESLHVRGEITYPVTPLSVPSAARGVSLDALRSFESVGLFLDRAAAAQAHFKLTEANAGAVADICHHVDGIPLALELAAARLRAMSVQDIATRLQDRFRLLTGGDRTALPRQQTLRALIDWSYDLLTEPERLVFRRLSVFAGGWTLEAAENVCTGGAIDRAGVVDLLAQLAEKSLVVLEPTTGRYSLVETVRQYAQEKLVASGEEAATRAQHCTYYVDLAEKARPELLGPRQANWLRRIDSDAENFLAAHAECGRDGGSGRSGLQLVSALQHYFLRRGLLGLAQRVMSEALAHPGAQARDAERSRALFSLGLICNFMGKHRDGLPYLEESLSIAREVADPQLVEYVLQQLGFAWEGLGDLAGATDCYDEAIVLSRQLGNRREIAAALSNRAQLHRRQGTVDAAEPLHEEVLALSRELEDDEAIAVTLLNLAMIAIGRGNIDDARLMLLEALSITVSTGSQSTGQSILEVCSGLAAVDGDVNFAARLYGAATSHAAKAGFHRDAADEAFLAPLIEAARSTSAERFESAERTGAELDVEAALSEARAWLSEPARHSSISLTRGPTY